MTEPFKEVKPKRKKIQSAHRILSAWPHSDCVYFHRTWPDFSQDIFLLFLSRLSPWEIVDCTAQHIVWQLHIKEHYICFFIADTVSIPDSCGDPEDHLSFATMPGQSSESQQVGSEKEWAPTLSANIGSPRSKRQCLKSLKLPTRKCSCEERESWLFLLCHKRPESAWPLKETPLVFAQWHDERADEWTICFPTKLEG